MSEMAWFITTGIVVSAFALPIVLARVPGGGGGGSGNSSDEMKNPELLPIDGTACGLVTLANAVMFVTILGFFVIFGKDEDW